MKRRLTALGEKFEFTAENLKQAGIIVARYPQGRQASAIIPLLDLAQRQGDGWLSQEAVEYVTTYLGMPFMQGYEVATFYSMFNLSPVGKYFIQVCTTTPCQLRGAMDILNACNTYAGVPQGEVSTDGLFSVCEVECLGACVNAPMVQINDDYYEDLTEKNVVKILTALQNNQSIHTGSQTGRLGSAPEGGPDTLISPNQDRASDAGR